jgi:hypothetical protein
MTPTEPLDGETLPATFVSRTGTRHIIGDWVSQAAQGRIAALCTFTIRPEDEPPAAVRDCEFCARLAQKEKAA